MRVRLLTERFAWHCLVVLVLTVGCVPGDEDTSNLDCSTVLRTFFNEKSTKEQIAVFRTLAVETKYAVFICGNQALHPPAIYLAKPFADEGAAAVGILKSKLQTAREDFTIHNIILVFQYMATGDTYDVGDDAELIEVMEGAIMRVKNIYWRDESERALSEIRRLARIRGDSL